MSIVKIMKAKGLCVAERRILSYESSHKGS
jgi:hypothetical protein